MKTQPTMFFVALLVISVPFIGTAGDGVEILNGGLRIDSINPITNPKRILVPDDSNNISSVPLDTLRKLINQNPTDPCDLDGKVVTEVYLATVPTFVDQCSYLIGNMQGSTTRLVLYDTVNFMQSKLLLDDWSDIVSCHGRVKIVNKILVNVRSVSNEQRIYQYPTTSLGTSSGTPIIFSGQSIPNPSGNIVKMFYDGQYFLFSYKAGNSLNELVFSRYSLAGTSLVYVDDVTFTPPSDLLGFPLVSLTKSNSHYYLQLVTTTGEMSISKYDISGSYSGKKISLLSTGVNSINIVLIGNIQYLYYNTIIPCFKKLITF